MKVTSEPACPGQINPFQNGDFIEYWCNAVPSMWAEKLYDGSFEGLSPYKHPFIEQTDFQEKPWYPSGQVNRAEYRLDSEDPVSGQVTQRIATNGTTPCTVGLSQDGIAIEAGQPLIFSCYLRHQAGPQTVVVRLHRENKQYAQCEFQPTTTWTKFRAELIPSGTEVNATLSFSFRGPGMLWIDNASLMPVDTVGGWRRDVVEAVRELQPRLIRFGGNLVDINPCIVDGVDGHFRWYHSIGDPDYRRPFRAVGGLQPTGPGLEEIIQFILAVGAAPLVAVKSRNNTPDDAANEVEYFNGSVDTPMGKLRARNGHPEPYGIVYWQVGNEQNGRRYEESLPEFCRRMKQVDPNIKLLSSYPSRGVLRGAGAWLDYVCPHYYWCAEIPVIEKQIAEIQALCRELVPDRPIKIGVTEWNSTACDWGVSRAKLWTLTNGLQVARFRNLMHRHCDLIEIANRSNLPNAFCSGAIQTDNHRLYKTPAYYTQQLYSKLAGDRPLRVELSDGPDVNADVSATLSADGKLLTLFVINLTLAPVTRELDLSAPGVGAQQAQVWTLTDRLHAGEPDVFNSFAEPERIAPTTAPLKIAGPQFNHQFPPLSLTVLRLQTRV